MRTLILSSLRAHRGRLALTLVAVTLSVSFVAASFVLADSMRSVFDGVSNEIYAGVDAQVRSGTGDFDQLESGARFPESEVAAVAGVAGVQTAIPELGAEEVLFTLDADGEALRPQGPPVLAFSASGQGTSAADISEGSAFTLVEGTVPLTGEIALDTGQARALEVDIGDTVSVVSPGGTETFTLSGLVVFGDEEMGVSPYFLLFDLPTMQRLLDAPGLIDGVRLVFEPGQNPTAVIASVEDVLPSGLLVADHAELVGEQQDEFGEFIDVIQLALLIFAAITTLVATFVIANTFSVLVGQQQREIGLLRSVGATTRQAGSVVVAEAAVVGVLASGLGLGLGVLVSRGIVALFESVADGGFPDGPTEILPRTIVVAILIGVGVTVLSSLIPAWRAARISPMQVLRANTEATPSRRSVVGWLVHLVGMPVRRLRGASGLLAASNVERNPRRVLNTAMSMIVGLALISAMSIMASSYRTTLADSLSSDYDADLILTGSESTTVPDNAVQALAQLPEVEAVAGFGNTEVLFGDEVIDVGSFHADLANGVVDLGMVEGTDQLAGADNALIAEEFANDEGLAVGDQLTIEFSDGFAPTLAVVGVFADDSVVGGSVVVESSLIEAHARNTGSELAAVRFASGADPAVAQAAVDSVLANYGQLTVETVDEHLASREAQAQQLLMLANGLLGLTVVIAMMGIANTIALSVLERTRELGLLRSVGMTRRQLRAMVRNEALVTSGVGAVLGVGLGTLIAYVGVTLAPDSFASEVSLPYGQLAVYLLLGLFLGVLAAAVPAFRASRLNLTVALAA